jgi:hypothetical protein
MKFVKLIKADKSFNNLLKQKGWQQLVGNNPKGYINALKANCLSSSFVFDNKKVFASYIYRDNKFKEIDSYNLDTVDVDKRGGMIVLSTDVNSEKLSENVVINWIKQKLITLKNRLLHTKMITEEIEKNKNVQGFSVGNFFKGRYFDRENNSVFDEKSISIEIIGISQEDLYSIAEDLKNRFIQQSVLVKDYSTGNIHFLN